MSAAGNRLERVREQLENPPRVEDPIGAVMLAALDALVDMLMMPALGVFEPFRSRNEARKVGS